jgi:cell division protein ZapA
VKGQVVHVDVQGQKYAVRSELEPAYIAELANYVDTKMQQAAAEISSADATRVAVIAALNLADELFRSHAAGAGLERAVLDRTSAIERMVDAALGAAAGRVSIAAGE